MQFWSINRAAEYAVYTVWTPRPCCMLSRKWATAKAVVTFNTRMSKIIERLNIAYHRHAQYRIPPACPISHTTGMPKTTQYTPKLENYTAMYKCPAIPMWRSMAWRPTNFATVCFNGNKSVIMALCCEIQFLQDIFLRRWRGRAKQFAAPCNAGAVGSTRLCTARRVEANCMRSGIQNRVTRFLCLYSEAARRSC